MQSEAHREPELNKLFRIVKKHSASDLNLRVGQPPMTGLRGDLRKMDMQPLTDEQMERLLFAIMNQQEREALQQTGSVEFTYVVGQNECRFRCRVAKQEGHPSLSARLLDQASGQPPN
jgi:twitching motility protein PilT